jgi:hypothetical protein
LLPTLPPTLPPALPRPSPSAETLAARDEAAGLLLSDAWQIFLHFRSDPGGYQGSLGEYGDPIDTVAKFWATYNNLPRPSQAFLPPRQMGVAGKFIKAFSMFRGGLKPTWEDPVNAAGGVLSCRCHLPAADLDEMWEMLVMACVGGLMDGPGIVGVRAVDNSVKGGRETQSKVELWYREGDDGDERARAVLNEIANIHLPTFECQAHSDKSTMERRFMRDLKRRPRARPVT